MAITTCKVCGNAYETTEEDANVPLWYASMTKDRLCKVCYQQWKRNTLHTYCVGEEDRN